jgi:hypothetical protein
MLKCYGEISAGSRTPDIELLRPCCAQLLKELNWDLAHSLGPWQGSRRRPAPHSGNLGNEILVSSRSAYPSTKKWVTLLLSLKTR